jgi:hypothetical protein
MKQFFQQHVISVLIGCCAAGAAGILLAMYVSTASRTEPISSSAEIPVLEQNVLSEELPPMQSVLAKHLFVPDREATGQNSFPDLVIKGVYLGTERNALFSLKSKPQANLRIWEKDVTAALDQVVDSKDPRQPIAEFLREWSIQKIDFDGVTVKHFITGEVETYAVDYTPAKKVKDDALRGYGQGAMPQTGSKGTATASTAKKATPTSRTPQPRQRSGQPGSSTFMADRVSSMVKQMSPQQREAFLKRVQQNVGGGSKKSSNKNGGGKSDGKKKRR